MRRPSYHRNRKARLSALRFKLILRNYQDPYYCVRFVDRMERLGHRIGAASIVNLIGVLRQALYAERHAMLALSGRVAR